MVIGNTTVGSTLTEDLRFFWVSPSFSKWPMEENNTKLRLPFTTKSFSWTESFTDWPTAFKDPIKTGQRALKSYSMILNSLQLQAVFEGRRAPYFRIQTRLRLGLKLWLQKKRINTHCKLCPAGWHATNRLLRLINKRHTRKLNPNLIFETVSKTC